MADHSEIREVDAVFVDLNGHLRGKRLPRSLAILALRGGIMIPQAMMMLTAAGDCLDPGGRGISDGDPDGVGIPVPGSVVQLPWAPHLAQVCLRMGLPGGPLASFDPRSILDRAVERLSAMGLSPVTAFELEFHVIERQRAADGGPILPACLRAQPALARSHGMAALDALAPMFDTVRDYAQALGIALGGIGSETGLGQFEINLLHGPDPARAADEVALLREVLRRAAHRHQLDVTFMAKPFLDFPGNGLHLHVSLMDEAGRNVFSLPDGEVRLAYAVGGLAELMPACLALQAPNFNSYRRFVPGAFVPVNRTWGRDNRSVAFRVPRSSPDSRRIEHRVAGGDANPHLVAATVLASLAHGLAHRLDPGPAVVGNANLVADPAVPRTLPAALEVLSASRPMRELLGDAYVDLYLDLRRKEVERLLDALLPRELEWYL